MVGKRFAWVFVTALVAGFAACGGDSEPAQECEPGTDVFCKCQANLGEGTKRCKDDGNSFEECITPEGPCSELEPTSGAGTGGAPQTDCRPGLQIVCRCENGDEGSQICNDEGDGFGPCETEDGACGAGVTTGGGTGGAGEGLELYYPCISDAECLSGSCPMGFCTTECGSITDCDEGVVDATCARFQGGTLQICAPFCDLTSTCEEAYGEPSTCGFGLDPSNPGFYITVCGDWLDELEPLDEGIPCTGDNDEECNLGNAGLERVCSFDECTAGCFADEDCPGAELCEDASDVPGTCF
jgi:hypothetical protein